MSIYRSFDQMFNLLTFIMVECPHSSSIYSLIKGVTTVEELLWISCIWPAALIISVACSNSNSNSSNGAPPMSLSFDWVSRKIERLIDWLIDIYVTTFYLLFNCWCWQGKLSYNYLSITHASTPPLLEFTTYSSYLNPTYSLSIIIIYFCILFSFIIIIWY